MKKLTVGILAHVDAGKTTLSESLLYLSGNSRKFGRVDNKDAFLATMYLLQQRGYTIFYKQTMFSLPDTKITYFDTTRIKIDGRNGVIYTTKGNFQLR